MRQVDHRLRVGVVGGGEVKRVDAAGVRTIDPVRGRRQVKVADRVQVSLDLGLAGHLILPDHRAEPPARRQQRLGRVPVIMGCYVEGTIRGIKVELESFCRALAGAERDVDLRRVVGGAVERARVPGFDEYAPPRRADQQRHGDVGLVVTGFDVEIEFKLHGPDLAAVGDLIQIRAQAVEVFGFGNGRPKPEINRLELILIY